MVMHFDETDDYAIVFMRKRKIIAIKTVNGSEKDVRSLSEYLQNAPKDYKKNSGRYSRVGFIKYSPLELKG
jgi:hypothetical protein